MVSTRKNQQFTSHSAQSLRSCPRRPQRLEPPSGNRASWRRGRAGHPEERTDMTNKIVATALTLGFLGCILFFFPVTTAKAYCHWEGTPPFCAGECENGLVGVRRSRGIPRDETRGMWGDMRGCTTGSKVLCCSLDDRRAAAVGKTGEKACKAMGPNYNYDPQTDNCVKIIGNVVRACKNRGPNYNYDPQTGRCVKSIARNLTPQACEDRGPNYHYDGQTGRCVKSVSRNFPQQSCEDRGPNYNYNPQT